MSTQDFGFEPQKMAVAYEWFMDHLCSKTITRSDISHDLQILISATAAALDSLADRKNREAAQLHTFTQTYADKKCVLGKGINPGKSPINNRNIDKFLSTRNLGHGIGFGCIPMSHSKNGRGKIKFSREAVNQITEHWQAVIKAGWKSGSANS